MASAPQAEDTEMADSSPPAPPEGQGENEEPRYAGFTRFEIELEFVQSLANPFYLNHLAAQKLLAQPAFVAYLSYLMYWTKAPYLKYLTYPGPTIKNLELLQHETFRHDIISPELVQRMVDEGMKSAVEWHRET